MLVIRLKKPYEERGRRAAGLLVEFTDVDFGL